MENSQYSCNLSEGKQNVNRELQAVSFTSVVCKILEHIIHRHIMNHCDQHNLLSSHQHGFRQKHSCESQLILSIEDMYRQHDKNKQVDMLVLDFTKAFETVPHQRLLLKLKHYGIDSNLHRWISSWLTERTQQVVAQIAQNDRPDVGLISGNVGHDIGLISEIISDRYRQMSADIGPTPCLHVGSMSARCRQRYQTDIWPI